MAPAGGEAEAVSRMSAAACAALTTVQFCGIIPTMTITADSKKRVVIPWVKPGDVFTCKQQDENHFSLARLPTAAAAAKENPGRGSPGPQKQPAGIRSDLGRIAGDDTRAMILIDTNVVIDARDALQAHHAWATKVIEDAVAGEGGGVNTVTLAELCAGSPETGGHCPRNQKTRLGDL